MKEVKRGCLFFLQTGTVRRRPSGNGKFLYESLNQKSGTDLLFVRLAFFQKSFRFSGFLIFGSSGPSSLPGVPSEGSTVSGKWRNTDEKRCA
jgi:hypothetical protein